MACGSPALAQLVQNRGRWTKTTRLSRFPGRGQRFVQGAALVVGQIIAFVVGDEINDRPFGQGRRFVENARPFWTRARGTAHVPTVRVSEVPSKGSRGSTEPVDSAEPRNNVFPLPDGTTHTLAAVLQAAADLRRLNAPVTAIVVVSAGGIEMNPPAVREVLRAVLASHAILHVIDRRALQLDRSASLLDRPRSRTVPPDSSRRGDVLEALARRTHGEYIRGLDATAYAFGLEAVRRQLDAEVIVEYAVPPMAPHELRLGIRLPGTLGRAIGLERVR